MLHTYNIQRNLQCNGHCGRDVLCCIALYLPRYMQYNATPRVVQREDAATAMGRSSARYNVNKLIDRRAGRVVRWSRHDGRRCDVDGDDPTARCCGNCYHYGYFVGYEGLVCEHTGRVKRRPMNYTNCKRFGFLDPIDNAKVDEKGGRLRDDEGCLS